MPGDDWQRFANLRLLLGCLWAQPGLLFMGGELGQRAEWDHDASVSWHLRDEPAHEGIVRLVRDLNVASVGTLHARRGSCRLRVDRRRRRRRGTLCFLRRGQDARDIVVVAINPTPMLHERFRIGLPQGGVWHEALNSDAEVYGGSGAGNLGHVEAEPTPWHDRSNSARIVLPPLACLFFRPVTDRRKGSQAS